MEMLIAILLWLGCISSHTTYHVDQINGYSTQHEQVINEVLSSEPQQTLVWDQYGAAVASVEVFDPYKP